MQEDELKKLLQNSQVPPPDESARERARTLAMAAFEESQKNFKGSSAGARPKDSFTTESWRIIMRKFDTLLSPRGAAITIATLTIAAGLGWHYTTSLRHDAGALFESEKSKVASASNEGRQKNRALVQAERAPMADMAAGQAQREMLPPTAPPAPPRPAIAPPPMAKSMTMGRTASAPLAMEQKAADIMPAPQPEYVGRDKFEDVETNPVKLVSEAPVSTFSIDADTTSYAFMRRQLNHGVLPQKDAIRIEELINYFDYDYPLPESREAPFKPSVVVYPTPWNPETKLLHIGIKGHDVLPESKPRSNLVFLLDVSGSMNQPDKLPLLKNAFRMLVDQLEEDDTVAIVVYAGAAGTVLEPTPVKDKGKILSALDRLQAGGSTAGAEGIRQAYALAESSFDEEAVNRVILATDGDFNVGIRNKEELKDFVERKREKGVFLSVLGFGQGNYNDALMQALAQNGNGNAAYIDTLNEARKVLVDEAASTLFPIAKDVKIQIEFNPDKVAEYRLIGYETRMLKREDFNNDKVDAGDIGSGHTVTALYEITPAESEARMIDDLRYGKEEEQKTQAAESENGEYAFLKVRYKLPEEDKSRLIEYPVTPEDEAEHIKNVTDDVRFAAAVAAFGQLLKQTPYTGDFTYDDVIALAENARGKDPFGYRSEFLNLVRLAKSARSLQPLPGNGGGRPQPVLLHQ